MHRFVSFRFLSSRAVRVNDAGGGYSVMILVTSPVAEAIFISDVYDITLFVVLIYLLSRPPGPEWSTYSTCIYCVLYIYIYGVPLYIAVYISTI